MVKNNPSILNYIERTDMIERWQQYCLNTIGDPEMPIYPSVPKTLDSLVVDNEPNIAVFGGVDGLDFYRIIFKHFDEIIVNKGFMGFEFGYDQKELLENLVKETFPNYKYEFLKDYNKLYRMLFIYKD